MFHSWIPIDHASEGHGSALLWPQRKGSPPADFVFIPLAFAAKVLTSHGGNLGLLDQHGKKALAYGYLLAAAMASRVATDI